MKIINKNKMIAGARITNLIILSILILILAGFVFYVYSRNNKPEPATGLQPTTNQPTYSFSSVSDQDKFKKDPQKGYFGTLELAGYASVEKLSGFDGISDYVFFNIVRPSNDLIYGYLNEHQGNSFIGQNKIGLGCYQPEQNRIYSQNYGANWVENAITGNDYQKLISSSAQNTVVVRLTMPEAVGGTEAPNCYSHFRSIEVK